MRVYVDITGTQYMINHAMNVKCVLFYSLCRPLLYIMMITISRNNKIESRYVKNVPTVPINDKQTPQ
jgi:hypothetical protein